MRGASRPGDRDVEVEGGSIEAGGRGSVRKEGTVDTLLEADVASVRVEVSLLLAPAVVVELVSGCLASDCALRSLLSVSEYDHPTCLRPVLTLRGR